MRPRLVPAVLLIAALLLVPAAGASAAEFFSTTESITAGDPTQTDRLFRDGVADNCTTSDQGGAPLGGSYHYDVFFQFNQTNDTQCVTVTLDAPTCNAAANQIYSGAYIPFFDDTAISNDLVASEGISPLPSNSYSFSVPPGTPFDVNVHETTAGGGCASYDISISSDKPWNTGTPAVTGLPAVGQDLAGTTGTWSGSPTFARQWQRCDSAGTNCVDIAGATGATYTLTPADRDSTIRERVIASEAGQSASADSETSPRIAPAPFSIQSGAITAADPTQTNRLFRDGDADNCTLSDPGGAPIGVNPHYDLYSFTNDLGATGCFFVSVDAPTCSGSTNIYSGAYAPSFSPGSIETNLAGSAGSSGEMMGYSVNVPAGSAFDVNIHEVAAGGGCSAYRLGVSSLPPKNLTAPGISGTPVVDATLTATNGTWGGSPAFAQQWRRCDAAGANCTDIAGATSATYKPVAADVGSTLRVRVTATEAGTSNSADSAATAVVAVDSTAPNVESLSVTNKVFAVTGAPTPLVAVKKGTTFRYSVSEAGKAVFTIQRQLPGRRLRARCVKPKRNLRRKRRCKRHKAVGKLTRDAATGANSLPFSGRIGRKALKAGRYRALLVVTDAAGNASKPKTVGFRVVKKKRKAKKKG